MILFSRRLDEAIEPGHLVQLFDEILGCIDWSAWEAGYVRRRQPPIHPRVLVSVIRYGLLRKIRSSRLI